MSHSVSESLAQMGVRARAPTGLVGDAGWWALLCKVPGAAEVAAAAVMLVSCDVLGTAAACLAARSCPMTGAVVGCSSAAV